MTSTSWRGIGAVILVYVLLAIAYSIAIPLFETPDENHHAAYVRQLAEGGSLPVLEPARPGPWAQEGGQPPLYYALGALLTRAGGIEWDDAGLVRNPHANLGIPLQLGNKNRWVHGEGEGWPWHGMTLAVHLLRFLSILLGCGTVYFAFRLARLALPAQPGLALAAAALTAFTPQFIFISASVNNDNLVIFLAALALWLLARTCCGQPDPIMSWRDSVVLGVVLGLAALTKLNSLGLWLLAAVVLGVSALRGGQTRQGLGRVAAMLSIAVAIAGWWYVRNWRLYGDLTGLSAFLQIVGPRPRPLALSDLGMELAGLRASLLGVFGWFNLALPAGAYRLWDAFVIVALAGLGWHLWRRRKLAAVEAQVRYSVLVILALWFVLSWIAVLRWTSMTPGSQGRLLMPALAGANIVLLFGWSRWWPGRTVWWGAPPAVMLILAAVCLPLLILPAYRKPPLIAPGQTPPAAKIDPITIDRRIRLVGAEVAPGSVRPGEPFDLTLYWEALEPVPYDASLFVHLVGPGHQVVGQLDSYPGWGTLSTSQWPVGPIVVDRYRLSVPWNLATPTLLKVDVGLYDRNTLSSYPGKTSGGEAAPVGVVTLRVLPLQTSPPTLPQPAPVVFDDRIRLEGYRLGNPVAHPGDVLDLDLDWQALTPVGEDLQIFVHLVDEQGERVAGYDAAPLEGWWPTSAWEPGQTLRDHYPMALPAHLRPGRYQLQTGLYRLATLERLPATGPAGVTAGAAAVVGTVDVAP